MNEPEVIIPGTLYVARDFLKDPEKLSSDIMDETDGTWGLHRVTGGRAVENRLTTRYGREGVTSTLGGRKQRVHLFKKDGYLERLADALQYVLDYPMNFVYCNIYMDGTAGISPHCDLGFKELPKITKIAALSFGAPRKFTLTSKYTGEAFTTTLNPGDLAVMQGRAQLDWLHSTPRDKSVTEPRLSLTFRNHVILREEKMK